MSKFKPESTATTETKPVITVEVTKAKIIKEGRVSFNIKVNDFFFIYGMTLIEYENKEGNEGVMISFPQWKGKEDYYNYCFFPIDKNLKENIVSQVESLLRTNK